MGKKALVKDFLVEIRKSKHRFISILLIVALGVAFFSGVRAADPDMRLTADKYFDQSGLMDIRVISTLGLTKKDVSELKKIPGTGEVEPGYMADMLCDTETSQLVLEFYSAPKQMNKIQLVKGRMPKKKNECLVDQRLISSYGYRIGDEITVHSDGESEVGETLSTDTFTIVGSGNSPFFLSFDRGSTTVGSGQVSAFVIVSEETFVTEAYTQIYLEAEGARSLLSHSQEYTDQVAMVQERVEGISEERCQQRYDGLRTDTKQKIEDGKKDLEDGQKEADEKLAEAKQKLEDGKRQLEDGKVQLEQKRQELEDGKKQIEENEKKLSEAKQQLESGRVQLEAAKQQVSAGEIALTQAKVQLSSAEADLDLLKAFNPSSLIPIQSLEEMIAEGENKLNEAKSQLAQAEAQIASGKQQIADNEAKMAQGSQEITDGEAALAEARQRIADGEPQLTEAEETLKNSEQELKDGEKQYQQAEKEARDKLNDGKTAIEKAEKFLKELEVPSWYVYNRDSLPGYTEFGQNADRIGAIGKVFPVIFFLVAALVSLTTMTRMVEEQRTQIGTLKALGYKKGDIAFKYIGYALITTLGGSVLGVLVGEKVLPMVIIVAYKIMYPSLDTLVIPYNQEYALMASGISLLCTMGATILACYKELASQPAQLMRPSAPKSGKRVVLEYIPFLWKHLNFTQKATFRNLLRYKKRFFMTIFGIGSCMGLLIVGFGLKDSIMHIGTIQYNQIQLYDGMLSLHKDAEQSQLDQLHDYLKGSEAIERYTSTFMKSVDVQTEEGTRTAYLVVPESEKELETYVKFQDRISKETYELDGVIITEQMAKALDVEPGDKISVKNGAEEAKSVTVAHVAENYMMHYIYMPKSIYKEVYGEEAVFDMVLLDFTEQGIKEQEAIGKEILQYPAAYAMTYVSANKDKIETMLGSLNIVIIVLIISAGMLAFVVLYNLNNINITERSRELATLKVLGFFDLEVAEYVYRENIFLTLIGACLGAAIGMVLHQFIIVTVEVDQVMFGRQVSLFSYLVSAGLTCLFSGFVNYFMYFKLKKIDMVESLKSIE